MSNWAKDEYVVTKSKLIEALKESLSKIHTSFDIWTSPYSTYAFSGAIARFITEQRGKTITQSVLLALRRLHSVHSGEQKAVVLQEVLVEYEIFDEGPLQFYHVMVAGARVQGPSVGISP